LIGSDEMAHGGDAFHLKKKLFLNVPTSLHNLSKTWLVASSVDYLQSFGSTYKVPNLLQIITNMHAD
jgi:hypothetical protein